MWSNEDMKKAKISELKANLSSYLHEVRSGGSVIVCDRRTPVAQLIPFDAGSDDFHVQEASQPIHELSNIKSVRPLTKIDTDEILDKVRGGR